MSLSGSHSTEPDLRRVGIHPDFWYPVARSGGLKKGRTLPVTFAGQAIVLARTETGSLFALEDRCAHRQLPLHLGVLRGDQLQCGYHGWCYDTTGRLARVPYLADGGKMPAAARCVRRYPVREAYGLIFVFPGASELAEESEFPAIPEWSSAEYRTMYFDRTLKCHYTFMHENLMDMNHQFLHRSLMGSIQPVMLNYRTGTNWTEAQYKFEGGKQHVGADFFVMGGKDASSAVDRDYELMTIRTNYPHQELTVLRAHSEIPTIRLWASYVPLDAEQRTNRSFGVLMVRRPRTPLILSLGWPVIRYFAESVFEQDRMAVEGEQRAWDAQGEDRNAEISPVLLELRKVLARCGLPMDSQPLKPTPLEDRRSAVLRGDFARGGHSRS
jgi:phenylpropionate dioxygenase-like ring-hydroxylating dioxygenase large terminal subunit